MSLGPRALPGVTELHRQVDAASGPLEQLHGERLSCGLGCHACCQDELTVFEVEAELIRSHHGQLLQEGTPHPPGACAFLDEVGACRIYEHRPYVCRTQGLPLRWLEERSPGPVVELRDICPLNDEGQPPLEELPPEACWTIGPYEEELGRIQREWGSGLARVALRELFLCRLPSSGDQPTRP